MADRPLDQFFKDQTLDTMPQEDEGHTCIYMKDEEDRNFKVCIECGRVVYRTDEELMKEYGNQLEKRIRGDDDRA